MTLPATQLAAGDSGVIHMGLLNVIRRMALREKLPIREIARRTGLSRNTIKMDLPGFFGERLAHFPGLSLEGDGALEAER